MRRYRLWQWGAALILLALSCLVYLSWKGLEGQRAQIWLDATHACQSWSQSAQDKLDVELAPYKQAISRFATPPVPGSIEFTPSADLATLKHWQKHGGNTTSGLPVAILAELELLKRKPNKQLALQLVENARLHHPSVITPNILETLKTMNRVQGWEIDIAGQQALWQQDQTARRLSTTRPPQKWHAVNGELWRLDTNRTSNFNYVSPANLQQALTSMHEGLPDWAGLQLHYKGTTLGKAGKILHSQSNGDGDISISYGVIDIQLLEKNWAKSRSQYLLTISFACIAPIIGIIMIGASAAREKKRTEMQNNFIASVTHELRAPAGSIRLMAEALESGKIEPEQIPEFHQLIASEGGRLSKLIENVLELSRIESGKTKLNLRQTNIKGLAATAKESLRMQAGEKNVAIQLDNEDLETSVDPLLFQQVLINLIDNAIKFSPTGGIIRVSWEKTQNNWTLTVTDDGPGIPAGEEKHIFNRFYRTGSEMRRETPGVGIGLNLVQHIVHAHGGTIQARNNSGAEFTLTFPLNN